MRSKKLPKAGRASDVRKLVPEHGIAFLSRCKEWRSFRTTWAAQLSPRLNSRNRSKVEEEWFW